MKLILDNRGRGSTM